MMTPRLNARPRRSHPGRLVGALTVTLALTSLVAVPDASAATPTSSPVASSGSEAAVTGALASFYRPPTPLPYAPAGTIIRSHALALDPALQAGTPDYRGLGTPGQHPYLVGTSEAEDVLDAARAARSLVGNAASNAVAVIGFSQGGQAALFAGEVGPSYAPELFLAGVAAVAPVTSVLDLAPTGDRPPPSGQSAFTAMVLYAWARHYRTFGLASVLTPAGLADLSAISSSCVDTVASLYDAVAPGRFFLPGWEARPAVQALSLIHISEPTRQAEISYA